MTLVDVASALGASGNTLNKVLTGNSFANTLQGLDGNDTVFGLGGNDFLYGNAGNDSLAGGAGADQFRFVTTGEGVDTIGDFAPGTDKLYVVATNFGLVAGAAATVVVNGLPTTGAGTSVYTSASGLLQFDRDGNGTTHTAVSLATLVTKPATLAPADIVLGS